MWVGEILRLRADGAYRESVAAVVVVPIPVVRIEVEVVRVVLVVRVERRRPVVAVLALVVEVVVPAVAGGRQEDSRKRQSSDTDEGRNPRNNGKPSGITCLSSGWCPTIPRQTAYEFVNHHLLG